LSLPKGGIQPLNFRSAWDWITVGVLLLIWSPLLGAVSILIASGLVWKRQVTLILHDRLNQGLIILSMGLILTTLCAVNTYDAILGLFNFIPYFFVFAALSQILCQPAQLRSLAWLLVIISLPVLILGIGQQFWGWHGPFSVWIVLNLPLPATGNPPGRMSSVFDYATVFASYLVVMFTLTLGLWIDALPERLREVRAWDYIRLGVLSIAILGNAVALIFTNSRNAWAIALLICGAYGIYLGWTWLLGVSGLIGSSILGAAFGPAPLQQPLRTIVPAFFWARLTDQLYPDRPVAQLRETQWQFAANLVLQRPWTGWGLRSFTSLYETQMHLWLGHPHNLFLMLAAEAGLPVALGLSLMVGGILGLGIQQVVQRFTGRDRLMMFSYISAFIGLTLFHLLDVTLFDLRINLLGWLLLAGIWGLTQQQRMLNITHKAVVLNK
jgi:O-antigen ligase